MHNMQTLLHCFESSCYTRFILPSLYQTRCAKKYNHGKENALYNN